MLDVLITGTSIPALQLALDLAEVGLRVALVRGADPCDPTEPELDQDGAIMSLLTRVAEPLPGHEARETEGALPNRVAPELPLVIGVSDEFVPQPSPQVWGIPAVVLAEETIRVLGTGAAWRAYRDRIAPLMTIGKTRTIGELARKRLGKRLVARLVEPQIVERYGVSASEVDVAIVAPGLNEALTRAGSLTAAALAYSDRNVQRETRVVPQTGWASFRGLLERRLESYGVLFVEEAEVSLSSAVLASGEDAAGEAVSGATVQGRNGEVLQVKVLVTDLARDPRVVAQQAVSRSVDRHQVWPGGGQIAIREYAKIEILPPVGLPGAALTVIDGLAVRILPGRGGRWEAQCAGPATPLADGESVADGFAQQCVEALEALEARSSYELRPSEGAEWQVAVRAAPFLQAMNRAAAEASMEAVSEATPTQQCIGQVLHGDDLSATLRSTHAMAVRLRRHLLGLTD